MENEKQKRGFAGMSLEKRRAIASKGGVSAHKLGKAHQFTSAEASLAGIKGGQIISQDKAHMAKIGRKGGSKSTKIEK